MDKFTKGYLDCALWVESDDDAIPLQNYLDIEDIQEESLKRILSECLEFQSKNKKLLAQYYKRYIPKGNANVEECAGHDFWLTRNSYGVGFWDRGLGKLGEKLTEACDKFHTASLVVGNDGKIYYE